MASCNYEISDFVSVDFAKSDFFREIWQISLTTINLLKNIWERLLLECSVYVKRVYQCVKCASEMFFVSNNI